MLIRSIDTQQWPRASQRLFFYLIHAVDPDIAYISMVCYLLCLKVAKAFINIVSYHFYTTTTKHQHYAAFM